MRKTVLIIALFVFGFSYASDDKEKKEKATEAAPSKAVSTYVVGILKAGPTVVEDSLRKAEMLESHVEYLKKLNKNGQLFASGALSSDPASRGLYIFNVGSIAKAEELMSKDESVASGWVSLDYHLWKTRDYSAPIIETSEEGKEEAVGSPINWGVYHWLVAIFAIIIITLMLRTFRMKPSV